MKSSHVHVVKRPNDTEYLQKPKHKHEHNDDVEQLFDLPVHWDVGIYGPENYSGREYDE